MGPPKILYPSVRSEAVQIYTNWFIKIRFGFIQICVKTRGVNFNVLTHVINLKFLTS